MKEALAKYKDAFPVFETELLGLRKIRNFDNASIFRIMSQPNVTRYYNAWPMKELEEADAIIQKLETHFATGFGIRWAIELKANYSYIGSIGFFGGEENPFAAEIGFELGTEYWRKGLTAEAIRTLVPFGFSKLGLERIQARVVDGNIASQRLLEKCGFGYEGLQRKKGFWKNELQDLHFYSIFKEDY